MLLVPGWDLEQAFMLDQIRRQDNAISNVAYSIGGLQRGSRFNIDAKSLAVWSMAPTTNKPKLIDLSSIDQENMIVWTLQGTSGIEISKAVKHLSFMNEAKMLKID